MSDTTKPSRTRMIIWEDPLIGAESVKELSGLEYLQALLRGELPEPPISRLVGMTLSEISEGRVVFTLQPAEFHYNPIGSVHGGIASTLFDSALGCAIQTMLPAGVAHTTLELHVNFIRAMTRNTGLVRCEGEVIHVGRSTATAQARIIDAAGKLYSHATTTCMLSRP